MIIVLRSCIPMVRVEFSMYVVRNCRRVVELYWYCISVEIKYVSAFLVSDKTSRTVSYTYVYCQRGLPAEELSTVGLRVVLNLKSSLLPLLQITWNPMLTILHGLSWSLNQSLLEILYKFENTNSSSSSCNNILIRSWHLIWVISSFSFLVSELIFYEIPSKYSILI